MCWAAAGVDRRGDASVLLVRAWSRFPHRARELQPLPQQRLQVGPAYLYTVTII